MNAHDWPALDGFDRERVLAMFSIYDRPLDFPEHFVVRRWFVRSGDEEPIPDVVPRLAATLTEARELLPLGLAMMARQHGDDPFLVEVWL
jgi:glutathione S-transferase